MKRIVNSAFFIILLSFSNFAQTSYKTETEKWRSDHEKELKSENSWFTLAGLFWLKEGKNTIGRGAGFDIQLTESFPGEKFGEIFFQNGRANLQVEKGIEALNAGKQISALNLDSDENQKPTIIQTGSQSFYLIKREDKVGVRLKDRNNPSRLNFQGLRWFPIDSRYKVTATFAAFDKAKEILIPNTIGNGYRMRSEGLLKFKLLGKTYTLQPAEENGRYFIIFRDLTSRNETYSVGRFLYAEKSAEGKVILDFNKAENPPCAYTSFATCPLPPPQNRLKIAVKAGEKRYHK